MEFSIAPHAIHDHPHLDLELQACMSLFVNRDHRETFLWPSLFPEIVARASEVQAWCADEGARILYPGHEDYPFEDSPLEHKPAFLACWGGSPWRDRPCMAVVGSREPSRTAAEWLQVHLAEFLRHQKCVIVSGGARGIDQKAHLLAVRAGQPTVVFLPSGLAQPLSIGVALLEKRCHCCWRRGCQHLSSTPRNSQITF